MDRATVSFLATVATVTLFLTNGRTILEIHSAKTVGNVPFVPYIATFLNCALWLGYGILSGDNTVVVVNGIGLSLTLLYMSIFYNYASERAVLRQLVVYALGFIVFVVFYLAIAEKDTRAFHLGLFCACASMFMFGSPLTALGDVIRTSDTGSLSFPLCFMNFVVSGLWTYYGLLVGDYFVIVPNGVGFLLAIIQLSLFVFFEKKSGGSPGPGRSTPPPYDKANLV